MERPPLYREILGFLLAPLVVAVPLAVCYGSLNSLVFALWVGIPPSLILWAPTYFVLLRSNRLGIGSCLIGGCVCGMATFAFYFPVSANWANTLQFYSGIIKIALLLSFGGLLGCVTGLAFWVIAVAGAGVAVKARR